MVQTLYLIKDIRNYETSNSQEGQYLYDQR